MARGVKSICYPYTRLTLIAVLWRKTYPIFIESQLEFEAIFVRFQSHCSFY